MHRSTPPNVYPVELHDTAAPLCKTKSINACLDCPKSMLHFISADAYQLWLDHFFWSSLRLDRCPVLQCSLLLEKNDHLLELVLPRPNLCSLDFIRKLSGGYFDVDQIVFFNYPPSSRIAPCVGTAGTVM